MKHIALIFITLLFPIAAFAQGTSIALGGISADPSAPVEIGAESLSVDQDTGLAIFSGNVVIGQGDLRLSADKVQVTYREDGSAISSLTATGNVTFVTATEAAEAESAVYSLDDETITLTGNVLLTQGASALSANQMTVNLKTGSAQMNGRVRTVLQQSSN